MMDLEPGRCRRTDGNKWRCGKNAVPEQKYCKRHMYRGCTHSNKHAEASQIANLLGKNSPKDSNLKAISTHSSQSLLPLAFTPLCDSKNSKTTRTLSQPMISYSSITSTITITSIKDENKNYPMFVGETSSKNAGGSNNFVITIDAANSSTHTDSTPCHSTLNSTPIITNTRYSDSNNDVIDNINSTGDTNPIPSSNPLILSIPSSGPIFTITNTLTTTSNINWKNNVSSIIRCSKSGNNASAVFGFFPKIVLRGGQAFTEVTLNLSEEGVEEQMGRSGGAAEMLFLIRSTVKCTLHRGAEKRVEAKHPAANFSTVTASSTFLLAQ